VDANQSRFHLVLGRADWGELTGGLAYESTSESVGLRPHLFVFPARAAEQRLSLDTRRGAGIDAFENHYWIAENRTEIRFLSRGERTAERFWPVASASPQTTAVGAFFEPVPAAPPIARKLSGLAVTRNHYLVVGIDAPAGLLVFDLAGGGAPQEIRWPASIPFHPFDMAVGDEGRLWILDRLSRRLWCLTERMAIVQLGAAPPLAAAPPEFQPVDASAPRDDCFRPEEIRLEYSVLIPAADPIAVEVLADGTVVMACDAGTHTQLLVYRPPFFDAPISLEDALSGLVDTGSTALRAYDIALAQGFLYAVGFEGNQAWQLQIAGESGQYQFLVQPRYFPMRLFTGKALIGGSNASYDSGDAWPYLVEQPRPRFDTAGAVELPQEMVAFDGREPGCLWHRVFLDACIPAGCTMTLAARVADREEDLAGLGWQPQPRPYENGTGSEIAWAPARFDTWELLLQQVRGRFLQLRVAFSGTARETPRVHALRVYYPRFSYLQQYLPAVFREDDQSASFLDRYLANPEGTLTAIEGRIQDAQLLFDGRSVPGPWLEWLASWMGGVFDESWDDFRRRLFVRHLFSIYRERGTLGGLLRMLRLTLDACVTEDLFRGSRAPAGAFTIRIVEAMRTIAAPGVLVGDPSDVMGPGSTTALSSWSPALGAEPLHQRYRAFLATRYQSIEPLNEAWDRTGADAFTAFEDPRLRLPALAPCSGDERAAWTEFVSASIGFTYVTPEAGADVLYRRYLARLYRQPSELNQAYGYSGGSALTFWADVTPKIWLARLKQSIPAGGPALRDWIRFVSAVLPRERKAHHFTVLIPVRPDEAPEEQQRKAGVARRITEIEKPAHTTFDVKLYFALFRVGEARLGTDTVLGPGSRFAAVLLGTTALASGYLSYVPPWSVTGRMVAGSEEQRS
jgi:phage tail-like protein